jgi:hypothetical protein
MIETLRELPINRAYSSDADDVLADFFIPALKASTQYDRLAGFFSSSSLAVAARGVLGLIRNGGCMKLVVCPKLSPADVEAIASRATSSALPKSSGPMPTCGSFTRRWGFSEMPMATA